MVVVIVEFFFFWCLLLLAGELCAVASQTPYVGASIFSLIAALALWLFYCELDLFASLVLALYSSVFILLSLFMLYFNRYWGRVGAAALSTGSAVVDGMVFFATCVAAASSARLCLPAACLVVTPGQIAN